MWPDVMLEATEGVQGVDVKTSLLQCGVMPCLEQYWRRFNAVPVSNCHFHKARTAHVGKETGIESEWLFCGCPAAISLLAFFRLPQRLLSPEAIPNKVP